MTPPRHVALYIPPGAGFTQSNLKELERIARWMKDAQSLGLNITEPRQQANAILRRIKNNGGYQNVATLRAAMMPYLVKFRRMNKALTNNRNLGQELQNARWRRVQNLGGRALALREVQSLVPRRGNSLPPNLAHIPMHVIASLVRPYSLAMATPLTMTWKRYVNGPPRPRGIRALPVPPRRSPSPNRSVTTTRAGRSVKPRRR